MDDRRAFTNGVSASLVLWGEDRPGMLRAALEILERPRTIGEVGSLPRVTDAWVRGFGPLGVVMLGFEAERQSLAIMRRGQGARPAPGHSPETMTLHETTAAPHGLPRHKTEGIYFTFMPDEERRAANNATHFQHFINAIASDGRLGVAQYEGFVNRVKNQRDNQPEFVHWLHLIDHAARGPEWLASHVYDLDCTIGIELDQHLSAVDRRTAGARGPRRRFGFHHWRPFGNGSTPANASLDNAQRAILGYEEVADRAAVFDYYFIHCQDQPGLFAHLLQYVRADTQKGSREIRSCCRGLGMGRDAVLVFAAEAEVEKYRSHDALRMNAARRSVELRSEFQRQYPHCQIYEAHVTLVERAPVPRAGIEVKVESHPHDGLLDTLRDLCERAEEANRNIHALHIWPDLSGTSNSVHVGVGLTPVQNPPSSSPPESGL